MFKPSEGTHFSKLINYWLRLNWKCCWQNCTAYGITYAWVKDLMKLKLVNFNYSNSIKIPNTNIELIMHDGKNKNFLSSTSIHGCHTTNAWWNQYNQRLLSGNVDIQTKIIELVTRCTHYWSSKCDHINYATNATNTLKMDIGHRFNHSILITNVPADNYAEQKTIEEK